TTPAQFSEQARRLQEQRPRLTLCFTGHTHRQHAVEVTPAGEVVTHTGETVSLGTAGEGGAAGPSYWFVNPGSVGDMATRDQRAAYAVVDRDAGEVRFHRVVYDRSAVLRENARHGLGPGPIGRAAAALLGGLLSGALSPSARP